MYLPLDRIMAVNDPTRKALPSDIPALSGTLAAAFVSDPYLRWFSRRPGDIKTLFRVYLMKAVPQFDLTFTNSTRTGAAVWSPPGERVFAGVADLPRFSRLIPIIGLRNFFSRLRGELLMEAHVPPAPHFHLIALGVKPEAQRRGVGSRLLTAGLDVCDRAGLPAYLETAVEANCGFYHRFGFANLESFTMPYGGPTIWTMWRDP